MPTLVSVGSVCDRLYALAKSKGMTSLSMWLRLAANDAYLAELMTEAHQDERVGIFDWDIGNDLDHTNPVAASFFGIDPARAGKGLPLADYLSLLHPDDAILVGRDLTQISREGGDFNAEYRVLANDRVRWLRASGTATMDQDGRPIRLMGSLIDVTDSHSSDNIVYMR